VCCGRSLVGLVLASWILAGCRTVPKAELELTTVALEEKVQIAPPEPLEGEPIVLDEIPAAAVPGLRTDWPAQWTDSWISLESFCRFLGLRLSLLASVGPNPAFRVESERGPVELRANSRVAAWDGVQFWLAYGPRLVEDRPFVHALDARKNLLPLLQSTPLTVTGRKVVLDPGHGGRDLGTQNALANVREKDLALDWALRLRGLLQTKGWRVILTRTNDVELPLADRVRLADRVQADLFISLHFNSALPVTDRAGLETYCLTPTGLPSTLVRFGQEDLGQVYSNNAFDEQNLLLALQIHRALIRRTGAVDGGIRRARFMTVLRDQNRPAILVEGGYLSTDSEAKTITSTAYRQLLAEAVAVGLAAVSVNGR
jgi:N-acetylmuramoyl-L-alanine amidase